MKRITLLAACILTINSLHAQSTTDFNENLSWEQIKEKARTEKKIIFIDLYATWCIPCKKMDTEVYNTAEVSRYLSENFISIKIQADSNKNDNDGIQKRYFITQKLVRGFKIHSFPSYLFLDANEKLQHRGIGYMIPDSFIALCNIAKDTSRNYASQLQKYKSRKMNSEELLKYAITLKNYRDDSLSQIVGNTFKEQTIDNNLPEEILNPRFKDFFYTFGYLLTHKDTISQYIYSHNQEVDIAMKDTGFSDRIIRKIAAEEFITPKLKKAKLEKKTPNWSLIKKQIANTWNANLASDLILRSQINWYEEQQDWNNAIKYHMEKFSNLNNNFGFWEAVEANNFIFLTVLKHSNDSNILRKAQDYMKHIITSYPNDYEKLDTYANVLYKIGKKEEAILTEKKALLIAEKNNDKSCTTIFKETILKMEANILTWD